MNNGIEKKIGPYFVDGYNPKDKVCYEYYGCFFHGHICIENDNEREKKLTKTMNRKRYIESQGYLIVEKWECDFLKDIKNDVHLSNYILSKQPKFYKDNPRTVSQSSILKAVCSGSLFGMLEVDLHVPDDKYDYFSEFSPIFCNSNIPYTCIGNHMKEHCENFNLSKRGRRLLVGGMKAKNILIASELLKW